MNRADTLPIASARGDDGPTAQLVPAPLAAVPDPRPAGCHGGGRPGRRPDWVVGLVLHDEHCRLDRILGCRSGSVVVGADAWDVRSLWGPEGSRRTCMAGLSVAQLPLLTCGAQSQRLAVRPARQSGEAPRDRTPPLTASNPAAGSTRSGSPGSRSRSPTLWCRARSRRRPSAGGGCPSGSPGSASASTSPPARG